MIMYRRVAVVLILLALPTSCNTLIASLEKNWHVVKMELADRDEESESIYTDAYLSFYEDGTCSFFNKNEKDFQTAGWQPLYRVGEWRRDGKELRFTLKQTKMTITFAMVELTKKWLVLEITRGPRGTVGTVLKCQVSDEYQSDDVDLLSPKSNAWRTKPAQKENRAQINTRVANHVDYLVAYFAMVHEKKQSYFETPILGTPFKFYANGMGLTNDFETDAKWVSNFYDEEDAAQGAAILEAGLASIKKYPADKSSYTKGYYNTLMLVKEYIEK